MAPFDIEPRSRDGTLFSFAALMVTAATTTCEQNWATFLARLSSVATGPEVVWESAARCKLSKRSAVIVDGARAVYVLRACYWRRVIAARYSWPMRHENERDNRSSPTQYDFAAAAPKPQDSGRCDAHDRALGPPDSAPAPGCYPLAPLISWLVWRAKECAQMSSS